jgi:hypothetical protein
MHADLMFNKHSSSRLSTSTSAWQISSNISAKFNWANPPEALDKATQAGSLQYATHQTKYQ